MLRLIATPTSGRVGCVAQPGTGRVFEMAAITSDPICFELSDDGTNKPESDVSCTSLRVLLFSAPDHGSVPSLLVTQLQQAPVAIASIML